MSWVITGAEKYETDPYRSQVSLLLHGNADGSGNILDSSPSPKTVSKFGDAASAISPSYPNSNSAFGNAIAFDGTGDYLTTPSDTSLVFGANDFTIEMWVYSTSSNLGGIIDLGLNYGGIGIYQSPGDGCVIRLNSVDVLKRSFFSVGQWVHLAVTRESSALRLFYNGVQQGATVTNSTNLINSLGTVAVGAFIFNGIYYPTPQAYIDDLRITKGVARYTANFTPPTAPFPDI